MKKFSTTRVLTDNISTIVKPATFQPRPLWHSPVPYLFGGLAAMLGLIAFALLLLACSYLKLSRHYTENGDNNNQKEMESDEKVTVKITEEKILVIMAGEHKPTYLATPVGRRVECEMKGKMVN